MALYEKEIKDGIQSAHHLNYCYKCHKPGSVLKPEDSIEYQDVFKLTINGLEHCICLKHFGEMLGQYLLVHKDTMKERKGGVLEIPYELINNSTPEEVLEYIEKAMMAVNGD